MLAYMHCKKVSKHHVTHPARDNKHRNFLFQECVGAPGVKGGGEGGKDWELFGAVRLILCVYVCVEGMGSIVVV